MPQFRAVLAGLLASSACSGQPAPRVPEAGPLETSGSCVVEVGNSLAKHDPEGYPYPADDAPLSFELFIGKGRLLRVEQTGEASAELDPGGFDPCALSRCSQRSTREAPAERVRVELGESTEQMYAGSWRKLDPRISAKTSLRRYYLEGDIIEVELEPMQRVSGVCSWGVDASSTKSAANLGDR